MNKNIKALKLLFVASTSFFIVACSSSNSNESSGIVSSEASELSSQSQSSSEEDKISYFDETNDVFRMNISTTDNVFPTDKENYINGSISISNQNETNNILSSSKMGIRLRGNSSLSANKKSFKIKFDKKTSLFGLPKAKKWNLIANYFDKSNLRNYLAYITAAKLSGLGWQVTPIFIDVYFNNEYQGLYLLTENIEVNEGRIDVEKHFSKDLYPSYLLEADDRAIEEYSGFEDKAYFICNRYKLKLCYPDPDDYIENLVKVDSTSQKESEEAYKQIVEYEDNFEYLKTYIVNTIDGLNNNENYANLDLNSFIDYYLIQEYFKNVDVASTSQFYIVDQTESGTILRMGPVWDFDIAAGVIDSGAQTYSWYDQVELYVREIDPIFNKLFSIPKVSRALRNRYKEIRPIFAQIPTEIEKLKVILNNSFVRNELKWPIEFNDLNNWIELNAYGTQYKEIKTTDGHIAHLKNFLENRLTVLDNAYLN